MKKRVIAAAMAFAIIAVTIFPLKASAVGPAVGLIESAFASYAVSSGYRFTSEEMDDNIFLGMFKEIYDDFITVSSALGETIRSWDDYTENDVYIDNNGQIVIGYGVAQDWNGALEWIQSRYNIVEGETTETEIIATTPGAFIFPEYQATGTVQIQEIGTGIGFVDFCLGLNPVNITFSSTARQTLENFVSNNTGKILFVYMRREPYTSTSNGGLMVRAVSVPNNGVMTLGGSYYSEYVVAGNCVPVGSNEFRVDSMSNASSNFAVFQGVFPNNKYITYSGLWVTQETAVEGLNAYIPTAITDVAGTATEDDSIVIGVGAVSGATTDSISDIVADGIRAGTLDPIVSITATDVIDTPVQPYPDVDGLGLPSLGAALVSRFPFCIPWDFVSTVQVLNAEPQAPYFQFDIMPSRVRNYVGITGSTNVTIDLSGQEYSKIGEICRWGSLIGFCFGLALLTKRMIWTS